MALGSSSFEARMQMGILIPLASLGSTIAGWTSAAAVNGVPSWTERDTIWPSELRSCRFHTIVIIYLSTPTLSYNTPLVDSRDLGGNLLEYVRYLLCCFLRIRRPRKELSHDFLFLVGIWWKYSWLYWLAEKEVGDKDLVLMRLGVRKDIGALLGLGAQTKDVINDQDGSCGRGRASCILKKV